METVRLGLFQPSSFFTTAISGLGHVVARAADRSRPDQKSSTLSLLAAASPSVTSEAGALPCTARSAAIV